jgi:hypothetical protein
MKPSLNHLKLIAYVAGITVAMLTGAAQAQEKSQPAKGEFSFDVYGDSRSMMYLPTNRARKGKHGS